MELFAPLAFVDEKVVTEVDMEHKDVLHVRTMNYDDDKLEEIVFDSGADVSALPLRFSHAGTPGYVNHATTRRTVRLL